MIIRVPRCGETGRTVRRLGLPSPCQAPPYHAHKVLATGLGVCYRFLPIFVRGLTIPTAVPSRGYSGIIGSTRAKLHSPGNWKTSLRLCTKLSRGQGYAEGTDAFSSLRFGKNLKKSRRKILFTLVPADLKTWKLILQTDKIRDQTHEGG